MIRNKRIVDEYTKDANEEEKKGMHVYACAFFVILVSVFMLYICVCVFVVCILYLCFSHTHVILFIDN